MSTAPPVPASETTRSTVGFERLIGLAFILVGALHCLLSLFMLGAAPFASDNWVATFLSPFSAGDPAHFEVVDLIALYVSLMNWTGWIAGGFSIYAGRRMLREKGTPLLLPAALVNLVYFPMGFTLGVLALVSLRDPAPVSARA